MLFDLRGRGRRRTVQVIYLGLALIFLIGFVGFGVGVGGGGGGLLNALTGEKGTGGASFSSQVSSALKKTRIKPNDPAAWAALAEAELHQAGESAYTDQTTGQYTARGKELIAKVARAWSTYLTLEPRNPSSELAHKMLLVFGVEGLNQPTQAVEALQIVIASEPPSRALYENLAFYSYKAHNTRQGDLAAQKAVGLAPAAERKRVKTELEEIKRNPSGSPTTGSSVPSGTYTTTVGGKTTVLKSNGHGGLTGTATTSSTPAASNTTSTKK